MKKNKKFYKRHHILKTTQTNKKTVLQSELEKLELQELESRIHAIKQYESFEFVFLINNNK